MKTKNTGCDDWRIRNYQTDLMGAILFYAAETNEDGGLSLPVDERFAFGEVLGALIETLTGRRFLATYRRNSLGQEMFDDFDERAWEKLANYSLSNALINPSLRITSNFVFVSAIKGLFLLENHKGRIYLNDRWSDSWFEERFREIRTFCCRINGGLFFPIPESFLRKVEERSLRFLSREEKNLCRSVGALVPFYARRDICLIERLWSIVGSSR